MVAVGAVVGVGVEVGQTTDVVTQSPAWASVPCASSGRTLQVIELPSAGVSALSQGISRYRPVVVLLQYQYGVGVSVPAGAEKRPLLVHWRK